MKRLILFFALLSVSVSVSAQYKETFDSNSLGWTECAYKNGIGTAIIDKGVLSVKSKGEKKGLSAALSAASGTYVKAGENTFFETHCYAPIDVMKPFEIEAKVNVKQLAEDRLVGLVFNYRDGGNFYAFSFNDDFVRFTRYENNLIVGDIIQGVKWPEKRKSDMTWNLVSEGQNLIFRVNGVAIMTVRYMPLQYSGFGFYAFGNQELTVDEVEFRQ